MTVKQSSSYVAKINYALDKGLSDISALLSAQSRLESALVAHKKGAYRKSAFLCKRKVALRLKGLRGYAKGIEDEFSIYDFDKWMKTNCFQTKKSNLAKFG